MTANYDFSNWEEAPDLPEPFHPENHQSCRPEEQSEKEKGEVGPSAYAEAILQFASHQGWEDVYWLGNAPYPNRIIRLERWKLVPLDQDYVEDIHVKAKRRIRRFQEAGFVFRGYLIAHELPTTAIQLDNSTNLGISNQHQRLTRDFGQSAMEVGERVIPAALGLIAVLGGVAIALAATTLTAAAAGLATLDPVVIGVPRDNSWIEIFRWEE